MKPLITIFFTLIFNLTFGQNFHNDSIVNNFINRLVNKGTDTILIYENGCVGCEDLMVLQEGDSCFYYGRPRFYYVFWKFDGVNFASKLSNYACYEYDTICYDITIIWNTFSKNKKLIKNERILPPSYIERKDTLFIDIDHYFYSQITVIEHNEIVDYEINDFYFSKTIDENIMNLNYERNSKSFRKRLQMQIENEIKNIEDNNLIKKRLTTAGHTQLLGSAGAIVNSLGFIIG